MNKFNRHEAQELMREYLIDHYLKELATDARTGDAMNTIHWLEKVVEVSALKNYFDIEDEFFQFLVDADNRPANLFCTVMNLFIADRVT